MGLWAITLGRGERALSLVSRRESRGFPEANEQPRIHVANNKKLSSCLFSLLLSGETFLGASIRTNIIITSAYWQTGVSFVVLLPLSAFRHYTQNARFVDIHRTA